MEIRSEKANRTTNEPLSIALCFALTIVIVLIYSQVGNHDFITFDDPSYVTENPMVRKGLSWEGFKWAFSTTHFYNWHPLTWLSHMLDCTMFGLDPAGHHIVNLFLHTLNTLLLFLILKRATGSLMKSAFVAAFFAVHPLHVESVAWVSERKDVLSTLFWMSTLGLYTFYAESKKLTTYFLAIFFFALGLMAKPMLVTLPFVLLLWDFWPLRRLRYRNRETSFNWSVAMPLIREKIPFFALSAVSCIVTIYAQQEIVKTTKAYPFDVRILNAIHSYGTYLWKTVWPTDLAIFYPYTGNTFNVWWIGLVSMFLFAVTALAIRYHSKGYVIVGWLWYLGTLIPVIGLVQVGLQAMADRYTYIPIIGIFIMVVWGAEEILRAYGNRRKILAISGTIVTALFMGLTASQVAHWKNSTALYQHAINVTTDNYWANYNLGLVLARNGDDDAALPYFEESLRVDADNPETITNIGIILAKKGKLDVAIALFKKAIALRPDYFQAHFNLGLAFSKTGQTKDALYFFEESVRINPRDSEANYLLGLELAKQGAYDKAIHHFAIAVQQRPKHALAYNAMGVVLGRQGNFEKARDCFKNALRLRPGFREAYKNLKEVEAILG